MKIEQNQITDLSLLKPELKKQALEGRFFHLKRVIVLETDGKYCAVTFTMFERIKAAFLKIFGKDYFKDVLGAKNCKVVDNKRLEQIQQKIVPPVANQPSKPTQQAEPPKPQITPSQPQGPAPVPGQNGTQVQPSVTPVTQPSPQLQVAPGQGQKQLAAPALPPTVTSKSSQQVLPGQGSGQQTQGQPPVPPPTAPSKPLPPIPSVPPSGQQSTPAQPPASTPTAPNKALPPVPAAKGQGLQATSGQPSALPQTSPIPQQPASLDTLLPTLPPVVFTADEEKFKQSVLRKIVPNAKCEIKEAINDSKASVLIDLVREGRIIAWHRDGGGASVYQDKIATGEELDPRDEDDVAVQEADKRKIKTTNFVYSTANVQQLDRFQKIAAYMDGKYGFNPDEQVVVREILDKILKQTKDAAIEFQSTKVAVRIPKLLDCLLDESHLYPNEKLLVAYMPGRGSAYILKTQLSDSIPQGIVTNPPRSWNDVERERKFRKDNQIVYQQVLDAIQEDSPDKVILDQKVLEQIVKGLNERLRHGPYKLGKSAQYDAPLRFLRLKGFIDGYEDIAPSFKGGAEQIHVYRVLPVDKV